MARILWSAPGRPSSQLQISAPRTRGAERRETRERAKLPERPARPPETPCEGVSFLLAIGERRLPALHMRRLENPLGRASGKRRGPCSSPRSGAVAAAPSSPPRAAHRSVELRAAGRNAGGRLARASRVRRVRTLRPRAPHRPDRFRPDPMSAKDRISGLSSHRCSALTAPHDGAPGEQDRAR